MARLPALIDALARHDRRGRPTIAHIARQVRDEELILSSKRGVGAAIMTVKDAATLLLATCGDSSPQGAVAAVHNLRSLVPHPDDPNRDMQREDMPAWMDFLREKVGFADAVERLIANAPAIAAWHEAYMEDWEPTQGVSEAEFSMQWMVVKSAAAGGSFRPGYARALRVVSYVPGLAAEIHLGRPWKRLEEVEAFHEHYAPAEAWKAAPAGEGVPASEETASQTDCLITIEVGLPTLLALHAAVNDLAPPE